MNKNKKFYNSFTVGAFFCFLFALVLAVLLRIFHLEEFNIWYGKYTQTLLSYENWIQTYGPSWITVVFVLLNYLVWAAFPWCPVACICLACGVVFEWYIAIAINAVGISIAFTAKYYWGKRFGAGNAEKIISKNQTIYRYVTEHKIGSPVVLFLLRFLPLMPLNKVSTLYGTTDMKLWKFLLISLAGYGHKLITYTIIGYNVFDPASTSFILPIIILSFLSGLVLLLVGEGIGMKSNKRNNNK